MQEGRSSQLCSTCVRTSVCKGGHTHTHVQMHRCLSESVVCRELMMPMSLGESPGRGQGRKGRPMATPWARMLQHPAVWAIIVNNFTFHYAFYVVMNWLPTYFDQVNPLDIPGPP